MALNRREQGTVHRYLTQGRRATYGYFAAFTALGMATAALGPTLVGLAENTQTQLGDIGLLFTAHSLGYLAGSFQGGRLYDRVAGHPLMVACLLVMALMLAATPLIPVLWLLFLVTLILGLAGGALDVGGNTLLVWLHGREVGPLMNGLHFFFGLGAFLSPIIVAQALLLSGDIAWAYWLLALLVPGAAIWLLRLPSPRAPVDGKQTAEAYAESSTADSRLSHHRQRIIVGLTVLLLFLYVGAEAGFGGWIFAYAVALDLSTETSAAYLTSAFWGALTLGRLLGIPIASRVRPYAILLADLLGCLGSAGVLLLWPHSLAATSLGTLGLGLFMASIFPTTITMAGRRIIITGQITGWFLVGASLGGMTLPWIMGQLFAGIGPWSAMAAIAVNLVMALGVFAILLAASRNGASHSV